MRELYFLCSRAAASEGPDWAGSLVMVKASESENMYLAASSRALAERILQLYPLSDATVVAASDLLSKYHFDFAAHRVAVIESDVDLAQFAKDRTTFPFEQCAVRYKRPGL
ncbi:MAG TPA: hypothetical protein VML57_12835 [Burkholderiales bacterium]|nr:hypothetical protein [Burkholderiales bacterium]